MIRSRLAFLKHIFYAVVALVCLLCALEVGLRVYTWRAGAVASTDPADIPIRSSCRIAHHCLLPFEKAELANPDTGQPILLRTNSRGLRGPEFETPKPSGMFRIVCLGDERTLGPGVDESETFCARLEGLLGERSRLKVEVVNAGIPDYCPLLSFLQLRHSLLALQPDLVIVNFDMSDISDDYRHRRHTRMSESGVPLGCADPLLACKTSTAHRLEEQFLTVRWGRKQLGQLPVSTNPAADQGDISTPAGRYGWLRTNAPNWSVYIEQALAPLAQIGKLADGSFARFVIAICPAPWQVSPDATNGKGVRTRLGIPEKGKFESRRPIEILAHFTREHSLPVCNTYDPLLGAQEPERLFLHNSPEFSPLGHELYARLLAEYVLNKVSGIWVDPADNSSDDAGDATPRATSRNVRTSRQ